MVYGTKGTMQVDYEDRIDFTRMREYREGRIQKLLEKSDFSCLILFATENKRYATSTAVASPEVDNMGRYAIVPRGGKPYIFGSAPRSPMSGLTALGLKIGPIPLIQQCLALCLPAGAWMADIWINLRRISEW